MIQPVPVFFGFLGVSPSIVVIGLILLILFVVLFPSTWSSSRTDLGAKFVKWGSLPIHPNNPSNSFRPFAISASSFSSRSRMTCGGS